MAIKKLQEELENMTRNGNISNYRIRVCSFCGVEYIGGTNSKQCAECFVKRTAIKGSNQTKKRRVKTVLSTREKDHCLFCKSKDHIDKNRKNNVSSNLMLLCPKCHRTIHSRVYNPLFASIFPVLVELRLSYSEIGKMFGMTRQNVYNILKR
jgi:hypothetical protein